jgi:hypothetical protein
MTTEWMTDELRDQVRLVRESALQIHDQISSRTLQGEVMLAIRDLDEIPHCGSAALANSILEIANGRLRDVAAAVASYGVDAVEVPDDLQGYARPVAMPEDGTTAPCDHEGCDGTLTFYREARPDGAGEQRDGADPRPMQPGWVCSRDASHFKSIADTWPPSALNA